MKKRYKFRAYKPLTNQELRNIIHTCGTSGDQGGLSLDVQNFLFDLIRLYERYGLAISHEDCQGGFMIVDLDDTHVNWMLDAHDKTGDKA